MSKVIRGWRFATPRGSRLSTRLLNPTGLSTRISGSSVILTWSDSSQKSSKTIVYISSDAGMTWTTPVTTLEGITTYTFTNLSDGSYQFAVAATSTAGTKSKTTPVSVVLPVVNTPTGLTATGGSPTVNVPTSFTTSASGTTINISWTDTNSNTAQTVIDRSTDSGSTWTNGYTTVTAGTNSYSDTGLSDGIYTYRARALIGSTYSSYTSTAIGNVSAGGPLPLYSFVNTAGGKIGGAAPTYQGAFRIPNDSYGAEMFSYSYGAMAYRPGGKIYLGGYRSSEVHASVAELNIPTIVNSTTISALNVATISQSPVDVLAKNSTIYVGNGHFIGGMGVVGSNLIVASYQMYDQGGIGPGYNNDQIQVLRNLDNLAGGQCDGFYHNKTYINGSLGQSSGSFTGWISSIPSEWQTQLGGTHLTGWSSSSARAGVYAMPSGPSAFAITPANWGASASDVPLSTLLNYYPQTNAIGDVYTPTTDDMYNDSRTNSIWTHVSECNFGMIIPGTRTYVVFGSSGGHMSGLAYGDPPYGGYKGHYTIDPYDKYNFYWMFDIDDLIAVKNGTKDPSAVMPYERGQLSLPFQSGYLTKIGGGSFDDTNKDLYLSLYEADNWGSFFSTPIICKYKFAGVN